MNQIGVRIVVAIAMLVVATVTFASLKDSDRWRRPGSNISKPIDNPYQGLSRLLAAGPVSPAPARDPFRPANVAPPPRGPVKVVTPPPPVREIPVLTAIVSDAEPQAVIRYQGRNYTVGAGGLFADYQVVSVTADAAVLSHAGEQVVLKLPKKGD